MNKETNYFGLAEFELCAVIACKIHTGNRGAKKVLKSFLIPPSSSLKKPVVLHAKIVCK